MHCSDQALYKTPSLREPGSLLFGALLLIIGLVPTFLAFIAGLNDFYAAVPFYLACVAVLAAFLGLKDKKAAIWFLIVIMPWQPFFRCLLPLQLAVSA